MTREALLQMMLWADLLAEGSVAADFAVEVQFLAEDKFTRAEWHRAEPSKLVLSIGTTIQRVNDSALHTLVLPIVKRVLAQRDRQERRAAPAEPINPNERQEMQIRAALREAERMLKAYKHVVRDMVQDKEIA